MSEFWINKDVDFLKIDLSEHDAQIRADAIDECIKTITNLCGGLPNINIIGALEKLKEQSNDRAD